MELRLLAAQTEQVNENSDFDLKNLSIPTTIKDKVLLAPGNWNGLEFSKEEIAKAFYLTNWNDKKNYELIKDHTQSVDSLLGYVRNLRLDDTGALIGDLELWDEKMIKNLLILKAKFGISARVLGVEDPEGNFVNFTFNNFSVVDDPACKKAYINLSELKKKELNIFGGFMSGYEFAEVKDKEREATLLKKTKELSQEDTYTIEKEVNKMQEEEQKADIVEEVKEEAPVESKEEVVEETKEEVVEETKEEVVEEAKESEELSSMRSAIEKLSARVEKLEQELVEEESEEKSEESENAEESEEKPEEVSEEKSEEVSEEPAVESELAQLKKEVAELKAKDKTPKSFSVQDLKSIGARADRHSNGILALSEALLKSIR
jgi:hypothetical protein